MKLRAYGWAVVSVNGIDVATLSVTRRGAMAEWLVRRGRFISTSRTDDAIQAMWFEEARDGEVVAAVSIETELPPPGRD